jgi:hypothetical protein
LASLIGIPALVQVVGATRRLPYISLRIDFTTEEIASVILDAGIDMIFHLLTGEYGQLFFQNAL